jgi:uncharacterized protein (TIGR02246 family)
MNATADITDTLVELERAWAAGDADAFAGLHTATASYLAFDGTQMTGPQQIALGHAPLFGGIMRGSRLLSWDRHIRFIGTDTAVVTQKGGIIMRWQRDRDTPSAKRISANTTVLVRDGERWLVETFQNTRYRPWADTLMGRLMTRSAE